MNQTGFVDFGFGEKIIRVPWKEFVWFVEPGLCALGLMEGGEGTHILGDTFLRAAFGMLFPLSYPSRINLHLTYLPTFSFPPFPSHLSVFSVVLERKNKSFGPLE